MSATRCPDSRPWRPWAPSPLCAWNRRRGQRVHRVLDFGAHGIMFPRIDSAAEAIAAVAAMRYPPAGVRGVAFSNRAGGYGSNFRPYMAGSAALVTIVQIESPAAVENADAIAAVDGVDVLFIGPSDLSHAMGHARQFRASGVCRRHPAHRGSRVVARPSSAESSCRLPRISRSTTTSDTASSRPAPTRFCLNNAARSLVEGIRSVTL